MTLHVSDIPDIQDRFRIERALALALVDKLISKHVRRWAAQRRYRLKKKQLKAA